ncbi:hypothetical protein KKB71_01320 [Patescibacteria group bacterium]|nr:hypothetical protein [Patescibacteria group bacterium]MBU2219187.1 hypothetical protein [Patescibacteria group bacterium]MBU2263642.1 hypothetical protein [Patescibacteria group bacterium]
MEKIKNIIEESDSFALILKEKPEDHELIAREAIKNFLKNKGKAVYYMPDNPEEFINKWSPILIDPGNHSFSSSISIHIPKGQTKIKEINYEDTDDALDLNIITENGELNPEEIILEPKTTAIDAVFCFGVTDLSGIEKLKNLKKKIVLPGKEKIVFISHSEETCAQKILEIMRLIDSSPLDTKIATLLFAVLVAERMCSFQQSREKTMETERELMRFGADKKNVNEIIMESLSLDQLPII